MRLIKEVLYVSVVAALVLIGGVVTLNNKLLLGPMILALAPIPLAALAVAHRPYRQAIPDIVLGGIDTGLLAVPAMIGSLKFGAVGALAGAVIGDAVTDAIAGFFEGGIARHLRSKGIESSRDPVTTALGKMAGCLLGAGVVLSVMNLVRAF